MKTPTKLVLIALFSILVPLTTFGATADVMVVLNGNTEVNRESYNFIRKTFRFEGVNYSVAATLDPATVKAGQYKSVVVLNTGTTSGLDPILQKFINGFGDKKSLFLINLYKSKGLADLSVTTFTSAAEAGVDGVTSASTWTKGPNGRTLEAKHEEWVKALVVFLQRA